MGKLKQKFYNFLRWSQQYTKTDNVYLVKGGFWVVLSKLITIVISLILSIAYANFLDPVTFGNYKYILSLAAILLMFSLPGMSVALIQAIARGFEGGFYSALRLKIKYGLLGSLVAFGLALYYALRGNHLLPVPLVIIGFLFPFFHAFKIYPSVLTGRKLFNVRFKYITLDRIISYSTLILMIILANKFAAPPIIIVTMLILAYFFVPTIVSFIFYNVIAKRFNPNKKEDSKTIPYGKHLSLMSVIRAISQRLDQILIFHYLGAAQVAIYSFAIYPVNEIRSFLDIVPGLALPKFSEKSSKEIKTTLFKKVFRLTLLYLGIMAIYIVLSSFFYKVVFPNYLESVNYSRIFALSIAMTGAPLLVTAIESQIAVKKRYALTVFSKVTRIGGMLIMVSIYGIWGIIFAALISQLLTVIFAIYLVKKL
jgi:O-antigen/teichoic acid export membrane protein